MPSESDENVQPDAPFPVIIFSIHKLLYLSEFNDLAKLIISYSIYSSAANILVQRSHCRASVFRH